MATSPPAHQPTHNPENGAVIEHFKTKAGDRGYQTLINEALKQAIQAEAIETVVRKTIREELRRA